jgi:hypothetical protein
LSKKKRDSGHKKNTPHAYVGRLSMSIVSTVYTNMRLMYGYSTDTGGLMPVLYGGQLALSSGSLVEECKAFLAAGQ